MRRASAAARRCSPEGLSLLEGAGGAALVLVVPAGGYDAVLEAVSTCGFLAASTGPPRL